MLFSVVSSTRNWQHCSEDLLPFPDLTKKRKKVCDEEIYEVGPSEGAVRQHSEDNLMTRVGWEGDSCRSWAECSPSFLLVLNPASPGSEFRNLHFSLILGKVIFFACLGRHDAWNVSDVSESCLGLGRSVYGMQGVCGGAKLTLCSWQPPCSCVVFCAFPGDDGLLYYLHLVQ